MRFAPFGLRKLADDSAERLTKFDPETGERILVDPADPLNEDGSYKHTPYPYAGAVLVDPVTGDPLDDPAKRYRVNTTVIDRYVQEGIVVREGEEIVHKPGGPADDPWRVVHTFKQADVLVFKLRDGDVRYTVVRQPDKYTGAENGTGSPTDKTGDPDTSVDWFYDLQLEVSDG